jgi:hypothetical protein
MAPEDIRQSWDTEYRNLQWHIEQLPNQTPQRRKLLRDQTLDPQAVVLSSDRDPLDIVLRRTKALIEHLRPSVKSKLDALHADFLSIEQQAASTVDPRARRALYVRLRSLQRRVALTNPLLDFDEILCNRFRVEGGSHMVSQYPARTDDNALVVVSNPFSDAATGCDLLGNSFLENGKYAGEHLGPGAYHPDLSFNGTRIAFARSGNLYSVNSDGSLLRQLTTINKDWDPCWLPGGRIAFVSLRRGGSGRCHTKPTYTMYSMKDDGSDVTCISFHETNEWHPSVNHDGLLVYTRWDYVDRGSNIAHHIWTCSPDGRDPRSPHGNYPHPITGVREVNWYQNPIAGDGRAVRPWMEMNIRSVPGSAAKYTATAAPHHGRAFGSLVLIDTRVQDDGIMSQVKRITPESPFPESEGPRGGDYATAWPLSEDFYLCGWDPGLFPGAFTINERGGYKEVRDKSGDVVRDMGLYLLDKFGNAQLLFKFKDDHSCIDPIPFRPRAKPPIIPTRTWQGERGGTPEHKRATIGVANVYAADMPWPDGTEIEWLRVVQVFPCPKHVSVPDCGAGRGSNTRMSLGVVPVEEDGSAYFEAPVGKAVYFQALDEDRLAVHSMRSNAFVHPGEQLFCIGCHEDKRNTPTVPAQPMAFSRPPSELVPEATGLEPISYHRHIRPIMERTCLPCHREEGKGIQDMDYASLRADKKGLGYLFFFWGTRGSKVAETRGSRTIPGYFGARYSKMGRVLLDSHKNRISKDELRTICLWLDLNSMRDGVFDNELKERERAGELVWPIHDATPENPQGIEKDRPSPGPAVPRITRATRSRVSMPSGS